MTNHQYQKPRVLGFLLFVCILLGTVFFPIKVSAYNRGTTFTVAVSSSNANGAVSFQGSTGTSITVNIPASGNYRIFGGLYTAPTAAPHSGYVFDYWYLGGTYYYSHDDFLNQFWNRAYVGDNPNKILYCYFKADATPPSFTVTLNTQGGNKNETFDSFYTKTWPANSNVQLPSAVPTAANHTFENWSTMSNGTGQNYKAGDSIHLTHNIILYAIWRYTPPASSSSTASSQPAPPPSSSPQTPQSPGPPASSSGGTGGGGGAGGGTSSSSSSATSSSSSSSSTSSSLAPSSVSSIPPSATEMPASSVPLNQAGSTTISAWLVLCLVLLPTIAFVIVYVRSKTKNDES